jgi:hypothetical protein
LQEFFHGDPNCDRLTGMTQIRIECCQQDGSQPERRSITRFGLCCGSQS